MSHDEFTDEELQRRIIYAMLRPAVRLALRFGLSLKEMGRWLETATFHELKDDGRTLKEMAQQLGISVRKASELSKQLKENFMLAEEELELTRRIEFMLWPKPLSKARIQQVLTDVPPADVSNAIKQLTTEGRLVEREGRTPVFNVARFSSRIVRDKILARIDGLANFLQPITHAVFGRFIKNEPKAFARVLMFRIRREDLGKLDEIYQENVWQPLEKLDADATGEDDVEEMELAICWAPYQYLTKKSDDTD